jgi:hypothetical protein
MLCWLHFAAIQLPGSMKQQLQQQRDVFVVIVVTAFVVIAVLVAVA